MQSLLKRVHGLLQTGPLSYRHLRDRARLRRADYPSRVSAFSSCGMPFSRFAPSLTCRRARDKIRPQACRRAAQDRTGPPRRDKRSRHRNGARRDPPRDRPLVCAAGSDDPSLPCGRYLRYGRLGIWQSMQSVCAGVLCRRDHLIKGSCMTFAAKRSCSARRLHYHAECHAGCGTWCTSKPPRFFQETTATPASASRRLRFRSDSIWRDQAPRQMSAQMTTTARSGCS